jgi:hypothetical protein
MDTRFTKVAKVCAFRPLSVSVSDFSRRMQKKAFDFTSRQTVVHGTLMSQPKLSSESVPNVPVAPRGSSAVIATTILAIARTFTQYASTPIIPGTESVTFDHAPAVRRSTRPRKAVDYRDSLRGKPVEAASIVPSMAYGKPPTKLSRVTKEASIETQDEVSQQPPDFLPGNTDDKSIERTPEEEETTSAEFQALANPTATSLGTAPCSPSVPDGKIFQSLVGSLQNIFLADTHKVPVTALKKRTRRGRTSRADVEVTALSSVAESTQNGKSRRSARINPRQLITLPGGPEAVPRVSTDTSHDSITIVLHSGEAQSDDFSGRTLSELEAWLKPLARPKKFPLDLAVVNSHAMKLSYQQIGSKSPPGLADKLVRELEKGHAKEVQDWSDDEDEDDPWK